MFSRKPQIPHPLPARPASQAGRARAIALKVANNPWLSAGGAGLLFLLTLIILILVMGDAKAGTPVVRLSLAHAAAVQRTVELSKKWPGGHDERGRLAPSILATPGRQTPA